MNKSYPWLRFWTSLHKKPNLNDGGFLFDPEEEFGYIYNPDVVTFEAIKNKKCLILLGEPGIGKSSFLNAQKENIESEIKVSGHSLIWLNLNAYTDLSLLDKDLFECGQFKQYKDSEVILHIYLDSLDECRLNVPTVINYLFNRFKACPTERLYVRIASRSAIWSAPLENNINKIWNEHDIGVYELVPLRRKDVFIAAEIQNINARIFIKNVEHNGVVPLASRPVTLNLLLKVFKENQFLPAKRSDLYHQGCIRLADEISESRRNSGQMGLLNCKQRLKVAAQIAVITLFGNYAAIWNESESDKPHNSLSIEDLCDCLKDHNSNNQLSINRNIIEEVLDTGLFISQGNHYMGWAHQTFAEYLVAWYLIDIRLKNEKIFRLLSNSNDSNKIIPQFYEIVTWLAELSPSFSDLILKHQPEILLESDILISPGIDKAYLVSQLLSLAENTKLFVNRFESYSNRYKKMNHADLVRQLEIYIKDIAKHKNGRILAMDIAVACELQSLQDILVKIALNISENMNIRIIAAYAVSKIADRETRHKLNPLIFDLKNEDPDDELKGIALKTLWPSDITVEELFSILNIPKNPRLVGAYITFLSEVFPNSLTNKHLPYALKWIQRQGKLSNIDYMIRNVVDKIMLKAWALLDHPEILDCFAKTVWLLLNQGDHIFNNYGNKEKLKNLREDTKKRRILVCKIIPFIKHPDHNTVSLITEGFIDEDDITWLLEMLTTHLNEKTQAVIVYLISRLTHNKIKLNNLNSILEVCSIGTEPRNMKLAQELHWLVNPILFGSEEEIKWKKLYALSKKTVKSHLPQDISSLREAGIEKSLAEIELGKYNEWKKLFFNLSIMENGSLDWSNNNILEQPGWEKALLSTKNRILIAAATYIERGQPNLDALFDGTGSYSLDTIAAYPALLILHSEEEYFKKIPSNAWAKWAPLITVYPFARAKDERYQLFLHKAYQASSAAVIDAMDKQCALDLKKINDFPNLDRLELIWNNEISEFLLNKLSLKDLPIIAFKTLLRLLLKNKELRAKEFCLNLILVETNNSKIETKRAAEAASILIQYMAYDIWTQLWPVLKSNVEFGRAVISTLTITTLNGIKPIVELNEFQIAEVYIWLEQQFPENDDPQHKGAHPISARDQIKHFRDGCISYLRTKGTFSACNALADIAKVFPEKGWLKHVHYDACRITRGTTWSPLKSKEIIRFIDYSESKLIRNEKELLEMIIIYLDKVQKKLQGVTPMAPFLWEETPKKPKTENRLAEFIKNTLQDELRLNNIVINREVEIKNIMGKGTGKRVDILVEAMSIDHKKNILDKISLVIEVKGCWNQDLMEAMETQLKNEYLGDYKVGLYLIGWYYCERWSNDDYKKQDCFKTNNGSFDKLRTTLEKQANLLSTNEMSLNSYVLDVTY